MSGCFSTVTTHSRSAGIMPTAQRRARLLVWSLFVLLAAGPARADPSANEAAASAATRAAGSARAVLYFEDTSTPAGLQFAGAVAWRADRIKVEGKPDEIAVHADIEFPFLAFKLQMSIRPNTDKSVPASHLVQMLFAVPPDFAGGAVFNVPGILSKTDPQARGVPFSGVAFKVANDFFRFGLSKIDRTRNMELLKARPWLDIAINFADQHRGIIAIEKGAAGQRLFDEALAAWDRQTTDVQ